MGDSKSLDESHPLCFHSYDCYREKEVDGNGDRDGWEVWIVVGCPWTKFQSYCSCVSNAQIVVMLVVMLVVKMAVLNHVLIADVYWSDYCHHFHHSSWNCCCSNVVVMLVMKWLATVTFHHDYCDASSHFLDCCWRCLDVVKLEPHPAHHRHHHLLHSSSSIKLRRLLDLSSKLQRKLGSAVDERLEETDLC